MAAKVPMFKGCSPSFIRCVVRSLKHTVYLPCSMITYQDEPGDEMYFIGSGTVELMESGIVFAVLGEGQTIGESALVDGLYNVTARSATFCNIALLTREDFNAILDKFPGFAEIIRSRVRKIGKREKENKQPAKPCTMFSNPSFFASPFCGFVLSFFSTKIR